SSHTHSGPLTWEAPTPWYRETENAMAAAIGEAAQGMFPASVGIAAGPVYLGFNRRKVEDGRARMVWRNAEKLPSHPLDPTATVLVIHDDQDAPRAVLVHYACHPSVLGPDNLQYSADYPGAMRHYVEEQIPGALCLFVPGAAGDINPYRDKEPVAGAGFAAMEEMGQALGMQALALYTRARRLPAPALKAVSEVVEVKQRWKPEQRMSIGMTTGVIGPYVCFVALPGEPFVEHQLTFRAKSECPFALVFGYSYSAGGVWAGYLPTILAAVEGGYGADYNTTAEVGAGEMLVDRGVVRSFELRGLLKELPDPRY
ncbi:MAG: hypothetical protein M3O35_12835, partial [Acidobacteriota bacterium]|nr:hypothetical protein [Acidobacteriota bacterium]